MSSICKLALATPNRQEPLPASPTSGPSVAYVTGDVSIPGSPPQAAIATQTRARFMAAIVLGLTVEIANV